MEIGDWEAQLAAELEARAPRLLGYIQSRISVRFKSVVSDEEILQETWIAAFQNYPYFRPTSDSSLDHWLYSIVNHKLAEVLKSARCLKRGGALRIEHRSNSFQELYARAVGGKSPSRVLNAREAQGVIEEGLSSLDEQQRMALTLHYLEGKSREEVAERMGKSSSAVNGLLFRGLRQLRKRITVSPFLSRSHTHR